MKHFILKDFGKWMHQNGAEVIDIKEGCLIDNLLVKTKNGYAAMIESPVNCWTSNYQVIFSRDASASWKFYEITR